MRAGFLRLVGLEHCLGLGPGPDLGAGALGDQPPCMHHAEVAAHLFDLGEQMARDEDGGALIGQRPDQSPDLACALWVESVGGLVEHQQIALPQQCTRDGQPLAHAQGVRAVALGGCDQQANPIQGAVDPGSRGPGVRRTVRGLEPGQVVPAGQVGVERRALDQGADSREYVAARPQASRDPAARRCRTWARPDRAACGSSSSSPSRWGRESRRPIPLGRPDRGRRQRPGARSAW